MHEIERLTENCAGGRRQHRCLVLGGRAGGRKKASSASCRNQPFGLDARGRLRCLSESRL